MAEREYEGRTEEEAIDKAIEALGLTEDEIDVEVVEAVHWHSTAAPGLHAIGKVVFLADKLDPAKARRYSFIDAVRALAAEDLDGALEAFLSGKLERLVRGGHLLHPASLAARDEVVAALRGRGRG